MTQSSSFWAMERFEVLETRAFLDRAQSFWPQALTSQPILKIKWNLSTKRELSEQIDQLKLMFQTNILKKAVPVVLDVAESSNGTPLLKQFMDHLPYFLNRLSELPETLYPYGMISSKVWILGATPEVLVQKKGSKISTHAVAGTSLDLNYNLLKDAKELKEHQYVIDDIQGILAKFGSVQVGKTTEKILPQLKHLVTPLEVHTTDQNIFDVAMKLHPTPALGGFPKAKAWEWLRFQKQARLRTRLGAPFGYVDENGDGIVLVAIRNLQLVDDQLVLGAGCGIVPESQVDREWMEVTGKKNSVKAIWNLP